MRSLQEVAPAVALLRLVVSVSSRHQATTTWGQVGSGGLRWAQVVSGGPVWARGWARVGSGGLGWGLTGGRCEPHLRTAARVGMYMDMHMDMHM